MHTPAVSVLLSTFNGDRFVKESVRSVIAQDLQDFEFLIVDDTSDDDTYRILSTIADPRIKLTRNVENCGLFTNLNHLIDQARAPLIKLWSQDDIMLPGCLSAGINYKNRFPDVGCFYAASDYIDATGKIVALAGPDQTPEVLSPETADYYALLHGCLSANIANLFVVRDIFSEVGKFNPNCIAADFEFMVRVQGRRPIGRIPATQVRVRQHAAQWSVNKHSLTKFVIDDLAIYRTLVRRLTDKYHRLAIREAEEIVTEKFAQNYFHGAVKFLLTGRLISGIRVLSLLSKWAPLTKYFSIWLRGLYIRFHRRATRRGGI